jgi:hypothetical protein
LEKKIEKKRLENIEKELGKILGTNREKWEKMGENYGRNWKIGKK